VNATVFFWGEGEYLTILCETVLLFLKFFESYFGTLSPKTSSKMSSPFTVHNSPVENAVLINRH